MTCSFRATLFLIFACMLALDFSLCPPASATDRSVEQSAVSKVVHRAKAKNASKRRYLRRTTRPEAILLKDLSTGEVIFEQYSQRVMAPASLTKIMSAIIVLEEGNLDDRVTVSTQAAAAAPFKLHLKAGDVFSLRDLLQAMLIGSANDACLAAAEHLAGTEDAFVVKMNAKAAELGLLHTQFRNACGFNTEGHYSTAEDLAVLTEYAMRERTFATIVREPMAVLQAVNRPKVLIARTTNRLMGMMDGVVGVKTGYTRAAGRCLITIVQKDERQLLLVLLNTRHRWYTAHSLIALGLRTPPSL
jgi:D-alanyl-D-alanine carboxypeptidase (penicillin-binding protein 5/6)